MGVGEGGRGGGGEQQTFFKKEKRQDLVWISLPFLFPQRRLKPAPSIKICHHSGSTELPCPLVIPINVQVNGTAHVRTPSLLIEEFDLKEEKREGKARTLRVACASC